jgi:hypothetical protein
MPAILVETLERPATCLSCACILQLFVLQSCVNHVVLFVHITSVSSYAAFRRYTILICCRHREIHNNEAYKCVYVCMGNV